ncbi:MAG: hypothetical protein AAGA08_17880 [Pseudomonadota bacterium]
MSDPVTNVEDVEDVLSSIRRLVTDTSKERRERDEVAETSEPAEAGSRPDALVLTSALRIDEPEAPETSAENVTTPSELESLRRAVLGDYDDDEDEPDLQIEASASTTAPWSAKPPEDYYEDEPVEPLDAPVSEFSTDTPEEDSDDETSSEAHAEDTADVEETVDVLEEELEQDAQASAIETEEAELQDTDAERQSPSAEEHAAPSAEIHAFDAGAFEAIADDAEQDEDLAADAPSEDIEEHAEKVADAEELSEDDDAAEAAEDAVAELDEPEPAHDEITGAETHDPQEELAEFETHSDGHDEVETVGIASFLRSSAQPRDGLAAGFDVEEPDTATMFDDDEDDAPKVDLGDMDEAVIDEEMLRDLVAEIVREELTGAMGERITRNVRKLVRREIHRAMVAREFD